MLNWYKEVSASEKRTLWGCFGGWALDALDVQMFSLAIPALIASLGLAKSEAGMISGVTLVSSALGGWVMGAASDRFGRVLALQVTIVWFSVATFACAFAQSYGQLLALKALQGFGYGGEWAAGAVLMAEMIRPEHRGKALGTVQSAWAVGWGGAVLVYAACFSWLPQELAWRVMFGVGLLPALLIVYVRRAIPEPEMFLAAKKRAPRFRFELTAIFDRSVLRMTVVGGVIGIGAHGGYHALMTWLPTFLKTERNLSVLGTGAYLSVVIVAFFCGCIASAFLQDRIGRRKNLAAFAACCTLTVIGYIFLPLTNRQMLFFGFPLGFFAAGIPSTLGALFNELYPSGIRGTGVGFCYNFGRVVSAAFPVLVGYMSRTMPLGAAIGIDAALAYGMVVLAVLFLPETKGKRLDAADLASLETAG